MVGTRSRLVMGEVAPRVAILAVILPYRPPLALGQIGSPLPPWSFLLPNLIQPLLLAVSFTLCILLVASGAGYWTKIQSEGPADQFFVPLGQPDAWYLSFP